MNTVRSRPESIQRHSKSMLCSYRAIQSYPVGRNAYLPKKRPMDNLLIVKLILMRLPWDRGKDVPTASWYHLGPEYWGNEGDRINDHHLTLEEKRKARKEAGHE